MKRYQIWQIHICYHLEMSGSYKPQQRNHNILIEQSFINVEFVISKVEGCCILSSLHKITR